MNFTTRPSVDVFIMETIFDFVSTVLPSRNVKGFFDSLIGLRK
jgi:hypothetical protein